MRWNEANGEHANQRLRLLVGDAQPLVAAALSALLATRGHSIVATVTTDAQAEAAILAGGIDVAVLDIDLVHPALVSHVQGRAQRLPLVIIAPGADHPALIHAIEAGVEGAVLKSEAATSLEHCLTTVGAGGQWLDRRAVSIALDRRNAMGGANQLTRRERDVVKLVASGQRNRNIADCLGISEGTVKMHLHNVYAKMGLQSRTQLAMDDRLRSLV